MSTFEAQYVPRKFSARKIFFWKLLCARRWIFLEQVLESLKKSIFTVTSYVDDPLVVVVNSETWRKLSSVSISSAFLSLYIVGLPKAIFTSFPESRISISVIHTVILHNWKIYYNDLPNLVTFLI
jgi:hypothetical protein